VKKNDVKSAKENIQAASNALDSKDLSSKDIMAQFPGATVEIREARRKLGEVATTEPTEQQLAEVNQHLEKARIVFADAVSVLSAFNFHLQPRERGKVGKRIVVDSALITGGAANSAAGTGALGALSGDGN
jgi:hypothetical protein